MRNALPRLILLIIAAVLARTWCLQGLFVPMGVASGSMAPTLLGPHRQAVCAQCGFPFACGEDGPPPPASLRCPNCDYAGNELTATASLAGDRVLVDRSTLRLRPPRRWEVVAFAHPDRPAEVCVKRVVGLPRESVQLRDGDLYVDGRIEQKPLAVQRAMAILVHDAAFRPQCDPPLPPRWQDTGDGQSWQRAAQSFTHPGTSGAGRIDWLVYHHWRRVADEPGRAVEAPITDDAAYNANRPRRVEEIRPVVDLMLSLRILRTSGPGKLWIRATRGDEHFRVRIDPAEHRYAVFRSSEEATAFEGPLPEAPPDADAGGLPVEVSLFDGQFLLAFDGQEVCSLACRTTDAAPQPSGRPFGLGSESLEVEIGQLRLWRDVYYTHPLGSAGRWANDCPVRLGDDEYFVLGDNSPVSLDSRGWSEGPSVPAKLLLGKALIVHFPARRLDLGPWQIQVPDPARIRYIR